MPSTYLVWHGAGGSNNGGANDTDWGNAYTSIKSVTPTADGDIVLVHYLHQEADDAGQSMALSYAYDVSIISVDKDSSNAPTAQDGTNGWIYGQDEQFNVDTTASMYFYGCAIKKVGTNGNQFRLAGGNGGQVFMENCIIDASAGYTWQLWLGNYANGSSYAQLKDCTITFGNAAATIRVYMADADLINCTINGTAATNVFAGQSYGAGNTVRLHGCDLTTQTGNIHSASQQLNIWMHGCKVAATYTGRAANATQAYGEIHMIDCENTEDTQANYEHYHAFGDLTTSLNTYISTNGASYNGTSKYSWRIETNGSSSSAAPYVSPWFGFFNTNVSTQITPYVEVFRDGSTTPLQNDEVWLEIMYKNTSGSTKLSSQLVRMTQYNGAPANYDPGIGEASWETAGGTGSSGTDWSGKLSATAFTPAEEGYIYARFIVPEPSLVIYVDPKLRT